jgi:hypothetical protein
LHGLEINLKNERENVIVKAICFKSTINYAYRELLL